MCKIENVFGHISGQKIAIQVSKTPIVTIFGVLKGSPTIFEWSENFTLFRNKVWNPPLSRARFVLGDSPEY